MAVTIIGDDTLCLKQTSTDVSGGGGGGGDPYFSTTVLIINPSGVDGSTTVTDESAAAHGNATAVGNAQIDTGVTDGGNPTMQFDGGGDAFQWGDSADWAFGGGKYWVEARVRFNNTSSIRFFVSQWQSSGDLSWVLYKDTGPSALAFNYSTSGSDNNTVNPSWSPSTGTFYDVAVNYDGNKIRVFLDGTMIGSSVVGAISLFDSGDNLSIGSNSAANSFSFDGWIARVRINKGDDRGVGDGGYTPDAPGYFPTS